MPRVSIQQDTHPGILFFSTRAEEPEQPEIRELNNFLAATIATNAASWMQQHLKVETGIAGLGGRKSSLQLMASYELTFPTGSHTRGVRERVLSWIAAAVAGCSWRLGRMWINKNAIEQLME